LANADLDELEGGLNDSYSDEGEANAVLDQMIEQYKEMGKSNPASESGRGMKNLRKPPAVQ